MDRVCKCGGYLGSWVEKKGKENYRNLFQCIDCGKDYWLRNGELRYITKAERTRIVGMRKAKES
jgi:uncharacterized protein with PIN domain